MLNQTMKNASIHTMKRLFVLVLLLLGFSTLHAQQGNEEQQRIRAYKIKLITERMKLSDDQASRFWPVYSRYENERKSVWRSFKQKYKEANPDHSKEKAHQYINDNIAYQEEILKIKKKYQDEMLKIVSAQQLAALYKAERDFYDDLIKQLRR